jgi:hypothetical protein
MLGNGDGKIGKGVGLKGERRKDGRLWRQVKGQR